LWREIAPFPEKVVAEVDQDEDPQHYSCCLRKRQAPSIFRIGKHIVGNHDVNNDGYREKAPENHRRSALIHEQFSELWSNHGFTQYLFTTHLKLLSPCGSLIIEYDGCSRLVASGIRASACQLTGGVMAEFDIVIHGGRLIDGTGNPWFYGDLAIKGGKI